MGLVSAVTVVFIIKSPVWLVALSPSLSTIYLYISMRFYTLFRIVINNSARTVVAGWCGPETINWRMFNNYDTRAALSPHQTRVNYPNNLGVSRFTLWLLWNLTLFTLEHLTKWESYNGGTSILLFLYVFFNFFHSGISL